jgi:hypothetical protein
VSTSVYDSDLFGDSDLVDSDGHQHVPLSEYIYDIVSELFPPYTAHSAIDIALDSGIYRELYYAHGFAESAVRAFRELVEILPPDPHFQNDETTAGQLREWAEEYLDLMFWFMPFWFHCQSSEHLIQIANYDFPPIAAMEGRSFDTCHRLAVHYGICLRCVTWPVLDLLKKGRWPRSADRVEPARALEIALKICLELISTHQVTCDGLDDLAGRLHNEKHRATDYLLRNPSLLNLGANNSQTNVANEPAWSGRSVPEESTAHADMAGMAEISLKPTKKDDAGWVNDADSMPPEVFSCGPIEGTKTELGAACGRSGSGVGERALLNVLRNEARKNSPPIWVQKSRGRNLAMYFRDSERMKVAEDLLIEYRRRKSTEVNGSETDPERK